MPTRPAAHVALAAALAIAAGCAASRPAADPAPGDASSAGRAVLLRFAEAVEGGRWDEAWPLLSARWRASTSPGRLAADARGAGPLAREAAARVRLLLEGGAPLDRQAGRLRLEVGGGRSARLVAEPGGWRVDALE